MIYTNTIFILKHRREAIKYHPTSLMIEAKDLSNIRMYEDINNDLLPFITHIEIQRPDVVILSDEQLFLLKLSGSMRNNYTGPKTIKFYGREPTIATVKIGNTTIKMNISRILQRLEILPDAPVKCKFRKGM